MGKRSAFPRMAMDHYPTPRAAILPLLPFIEGMSAFAEPCCGDGDLMLHLEDLLPIRCTYAGDIRTGKDAFSLTRDDLGGAEEINSNPPWTRSILHPLILHLQRLAPTWLLLDASWAHTVQAGPYLDQCSHIVSVGRVKWMPDSPYTGKDDAAWFRFHAPHVGGPRFFGRA